MTDSRDDRAAGKTPDGAESLADEEQGAGDKDTHQETSAKTGTLLDTTDDVPGSNAPAAETPADPWEGLKQRLAKGDTKILNQLNRYASLENFARAGLAAQQKIRSGEFAKPLAEDASVAEIAEYRKQNGIPAEPSGYALPEINGYEWGEEDKEVAEAFLERMHRQNAAPALVSDALQWYGEHVAAEREAQAVLDKEDRDKTENDLRAQFGPDYRPTMALISRLVEDEASGFGALGIDILKARLPDGRQLGAVSDFMGPLAALARTTYGDGGFVAGDAAAAITERKQEIRAIMKAEPERYYREGLDKEYLDILEREQKAKASAA